MVREESCEKRCSGHSCYVVLSIANTREAQLIHCYPALEEVTGNPTFIFMNELFGFTAPPLYARLRCSFSPSKRYFFCLQTHKSHLRHTGAPAQVAEHSQARTEQGQPLAVKVLNHNRWQPLFVGGGEKTCLQ